MRREEGKEGWGEERGRERGVGKKKVGRERGVGEERGRKRGVGKTKVKKEEGEEEWGRKR